MHGEVSNGYFAYFVEKILEKLDATDNLVVRLHEWIINKPELEPALIGQIKEFIDNLNTRKEIKANY